jgi:preprotein translocase subunit SecE
MAEKSLLDDPNVEPGLARFVKDSKSEVDKVEWPSRKDTRTMTFVVIVLSAVMALLLGGLDLILTTLYSGLRTILGV